MKQLQALRRQAGLSQQELAVRMGLSATRVSRIESSSPLDLKPDTLGRYVAFGSRGAPGKRGTKPLKQHAIRLSGTARFDKWYA